MNFPGLDLSWTLFHRIAERLGAVRPWKQDEIQASLRRGDGVLVVATTALGDTLLCTPLLQTLADALGPKRVGFLVRDDYRALYANDPRIGHLFTMPGKFRGFAKLKQDLRKVEPPFRIALIANCTEPDLIPWLWHCGLHGFLRYRSRWSVWSNWFANRDMLRRPEQSGYATGHAIENNLAMALALGLKPACRTLSVHWPAIDVPAQSRNERLVLLHPGASRPEKRWPLENWRLVAEELAANFGCTFAITGSVVEKKMASELAGQLPFPVENWAGKLGLTELAERQKSAALFLSGDTGPYHLALAVNCPTVTLFAPVDRGSSLEACGPHQANPQLHRALQTVQFGDSIQTISVREVLDAAASALKGMK
jgi:ADP-heptose:LPS heptosyltransferase